MKKKSSLSFRQEFGKILTDISIDHEPVLIERNSEPVAVVVSYEVFKRKFIEFQEQSERIKLLERFKSASKPANGNSLENLRSLRYGE